MKTRPILFSGAMVRAILAGKKTQTRRPVNPQPAPNAPSDGGTSWVFRPGDGLHVPCGTVGHLGVREKMGLRCPFGAPKDSLWVRERARVLDYTDRPGMARLRYEADGAEAWKEWPARLRPVPVGRCISNGVHREGARLFLEVLSVRVERLDDISETDALAEGFAPGVEELLGGLKVSLSARDYFKNTWCELYGYASWDANPWLWVVEFRRVENR